MMIISEMSENELFNFCSEHSYEDGIIELYQSFSYIDEYVENEYILISEYLLKDNDIFNLDLSLIEFIARALGKSDLLFSKIKIRTNDDIDHIQSILSWAFQFFYYQESKGLIQGQLINEIFTSSYIPSDVKFDFNSLSVRQIIIIEFI